MKKTTALLPVSLMLLNATAALGALPPFWQSVREIEALLKNRELYTRLHSVAPIKDIQQTDEGYKLTTRDGCFVVAKVKYLPTEMVGAAKFELEIVDSGCKK